MKLTVYGLVFIGLLVGTLALPTNVEVAKDVSPMESMPEMAVKNIETKTAADLNKTEATVKPASPDEPIRTETPMETSMKMETEPKMETETKSKTSELPDITTNQMEAKQVEVPEKKLESSTDQAEKEIGLLETEEKDKQMNAAESTQTPTKQPTKKFTNGRDWEGVHKQTDSWHDFDDKYSLLEDRLPDLTDEEFLEINKEDSIPLNFLKGFDISKEMIKAVKLPEKEVSIKDIAGRPLEKSETPVYITIPIVINSHSTLPISLSIGGQDVPLKIPLKDSAEDLAPAPGGQINKLLNYNATPRRQTNRHRSNLRSKIYARNKRHEVFEFKRDIA